MIWFVTLSELVTLEKHSSKWHFFQNFFNEPPIQPMAVRSMDEGEGGTSKRDSFAAYLQLQRRITYEFPYVKRVA